VGVHPNVYFEVTDGTWTDFEYVTVEVTEPAVPGDLNKDKGVDLADAILVLKVSVGIHPPEMDSRADVNGDGKINTAEGIYILEKIVREAETAE
jgi:hypothetical protein